MVLILCFALDKTVVYLSNDTMQLDVTIFRFFIFTNMKGFFIFGKLQMSYLQIVSACGP